MLSAIFIIVFYHLGFEVLSGKSNNISLNNQIIFVILSLSFWLLHILLTSYEIKEKNVNTIELLEKSTSPIFSLLVSAVLTISSLLLLKHFSLNYEIIKIFEIKFTQRGIIPPITLLLFYWGFLILLDKYISLFKNNLTKQAIMKQPIINKDFWDLLKDIKESFYELVRYINYAIPILGFIGTVLGISLSAEGITKIIKSPEGLTTNSQALGDAIAPLGIAFDTTLIALSLGLILMLMQTITQKTELSKLNKLQNQYSNN
ncbi:hypothetical protein MNB_SUP05-5-819 [hydrothermal vent metagenome]|uniref:MotA/TolQ/ExbB proton channel domain-containing protein n=1 Tax=hydrothermal vent metagenome TaxID=652676 RepID=A0A1W1BEN1_9ZZZZ